MNIVFPSLSPELYRHEKPGFVAPASLPALRAMLCATNSKFFENFA